jgi:hypothetical protein
MQSQPQAAYYAAARSLRSFADKQGWNECSVKKDPSGKACITNPNGQTFYATLSPNKDKCVLSSDSPEIDQRLRLDWDLHQADHAAHLLPNTSKIETEERTIRLAQNLQATDPDIKVVGYDITRQNGKNMIMLDLEKTGNDTGRRWKNPSRRGRTKSPKPSPKPGR